LSALWPIVADPAWGSFSKWLSPRFALERNKTTVSHAQ
jgi:hypothetical protein